MKKELTDLTKEELIIEVQARDQVLKSYAKSNERLERLLGMINAIQK